MTDAMPPDLAADLWVYPLGYGDTLASHEWVELHVHRVLTSRFIAHAIAAGRRADIGTALLLWCECFRQDPAGTLPDDDEQLAQLAKFGTDLAGWREARPLALYGFRPTVIEDAGAGDRPRLGHPFIAEVAFRMARRKSARAQGREAQRLAVTKSRVKTKMEAIGHKRLAAQPQVVAAVAEWLFSGQLFITGDNILAALAELGVPHVVAGTGSKEGRAGR